MKSERELSLPEGLERWTTTCFTSENAVCKSLELHDFHYYWINRKVKHTFCLTSDNWKVDLSDDVSEHAWASTVVPRTLPSTNDAGFGSSTTDEPSCGSRSCSSFNLLPRRESSERKTTTDSTGTDTNQPSSSSPPFPGIHPSLLRYPSSSPRSRSPSPSPPSSRLSPQNTTAPATVSSHRDSTNSSKHSSPSPSPQQETQAHRRTPSPGPAGSHAAVNPPASAPFLKFGVNAILSSQISPKNGK